MAEVSVHAPGVQPTTSQVQGWLSRRIAERCALPESEIDPRRSPASYGLDSLAAVEISGDLEQWLGVPISPTLAYEHPTIERLAHHLAQRCAAHAAATQPAAGAGPIAIVGMACRFPGAADIHAFWRLLREGVDAVGDLPRERWRDGPALRSAPPGGFLTVLDLFDADFFGISAAEAESMDPQQRLLLELAWEALDDAGQDAQRLAGSDAGVFVGISNNDYLRIQPRDRHRNDLFWSTGNALSIAANRVSYQLDLRGPSLAIDTACSSSLVAVHLAARAIDSGECAIALAGGVNLIIAPDVSTNFVEVGAMSRSGRCRAFDAAADGMVRGEGAALVVLKPLERALADGDRVRAVIRGSAVTQDGRTNGLAAPSREAQEAVLRRALLAAGLGPSDVQYVEAHGTGTLLGDPIEAKALGAVLSAGRSSADDVWWIGSVKTNCGHLEAAAGVAGLVKAVLSLGHRAIPPHLHFVRSNPYIDLDRLGLRIPSRLTVWPDVDRARAGVSAFGFGGTNAHVVLEEAPRQDAATSDADGPYMLTLSARTGTALAELAVRYRDLLAAADERPRLEDVCWSSLRRTHHPVRLAMVIHTREDAVAKLDDEIRRIAAPAGADGPARTAGVAGTPETTRGRARVTQPPLFVYSAFASGLDSVGDQLSRRSVAFRTALEACRAALGPEDGCGALERGQHRTFALQVALTALYRSLGIAPAAVIGYSMGEVAAAHAAGALSLESAARVLRERSRLLQHGLHGQSTGGGMAIVRLPRAAAQADVDAAGHLGIAAVNSPEQVVVSGDADALDRLLATWRARRIAFRRIHLPGAGHSPDVRRAATALLDSLRDVAASAPALCFYSTVTGGRFDEPTAAAYWTRNVGEPVLLADAVSAAAGDGFTDFVEIGADNTLCASIHQVLAHARRHGLAVPAIARGADEWKSVLATVTRLYVAGHTVDWTTVVDRRGAVVDLPAYPWQRQRYWIPGARDDEPAAPARSARHVLAGRIDVAYPEGHTYWRGRLEPGTYAWLHDHRVQGVRVLTSAAFLAAAIDAAEAVGGGLPQTIEDVELQRALFLPPSGEIETEIAVTPDGPEARRVRFSSRSAGDAAWTTHAVARIRPRQAAARNSRALDRSVARHGESIPTSAFYAAAAAAGVEYGPSFQRIEALWRDGVSALGRIAAAPAPGSLHGGFQFEPAVLDACLQVLAATAPAAMSGVVLPTAVRRMTLHRRPAAVLWSCARAAGVQGPDATEFEGCVDIFDDDGNLVAEVEGFRVRRVDESGVAEADGTYAIGWAPLEPSPAMAGHEQPSPWLITGGAPDLADALAASLAAAGQRSMISRREDVDVIGSAPACTRIVCLVGAGSLDASIEVSSRARDCCLRLLRVIRQIATAPNSPRLWIVTTGAQSVGSQAQVTVAEAPAWGLARTLAQEHPAAWGAAIDLDPAATTSDNAQWLAEALLQADGEDQIAIRAGRRFGARLERARLPVAAAVRLRPDATYLVTGGLGDLGLVVARWLVDSGARHLLLIGRAPLPPRREWQGLPPGTREHARVQRLLAIEAAGAAVHVATADVACYDALRATLDGFAAESRPPIRGVLHLAGDVHGAPLAELTDDAVLADLEPKAIGAWNLHRCFARDAVEFFILFSSGSAVLGSPFLAGYAAANAFLDALAHARQQDGLAALSINWGFWAESGVAARRLREHGDRGAPPGMRGMDDRGALNRLGRAWSWRGPQVVVMPMAWREWAARHPSAAASPMVASLTGRTGPRAATAPWPSAAELRAAGPDARAALIERALAGHIARVLSVDRVDGTQPLTAMGIDSLMAVEIRNRIETEWALTLPMVHLLQGPTLSELSAVIAGQVGAVPHSPCEGSPAVASQELAVLAGLSDADVDRLLASGLRSQTADE